MQIGICKIKIRIPENQDLKGKRKIINSFCGRIESRFKVAIAEVEDHDLWQVATVGIACIGNDAKVLQQTLSKIQNYVESIAGDFELLDWQQKIIAIF